MLCMVARTCSRVASFGMTCRLVNGGVPPARCPAPGAVPPGGGCCAKAEDATTRTSPVASAAKRVMKDLAGLLVLRLSGPTVSATCQSASPVHMPDRVYAEDTGWRTNDSQRRYCGS